MAPSAAAAAAAPPLWLWLWLLSLGCGRSGGGWGGEEGPQVVVSASGVEVQVSAASGGVVRAELLDPGGDPLVGQRLARPAETVELRHRLTAPGVYTVRLWDAEGRVTEVAVPVAAEAEALAPLEVVVEAPVGQGQRSVQAGERVPVTVIAGQSAQVAVTLTALEAGAAWVTVAGEEVAARPLLRAGERLVGRATVAAAAAAADPSAAVWVEVGLGASRRGFWLAPQAVSAEAARSALRLVRLDFPADGTGRADRTRPPDRVTLPAPWWRGVLGGLGLSGARPLGGDVPWSWLGVTLENTGSEAINVAISARVLDAAGAPDPAFRPRMRDGEDPSGWVSVLLRVPAGEAARAALPVYVDALLLQRGGSGGGGWTREVRVTPLGAEQPLLTVQAPLRVRQGSSVASLGLGVALLAALLGTLLGALGVPVWLRRARTSELMTVALFGALSFLVGAAGQLLGMGVGALLGPFSILVTGLVDDVLRYALWATLLTLLPRPGTAALGLLTHWLLSGVALGAFGPTDVLFVGGRILWMEGALWLVGITRSRRWLAQGRGWRWLRLSAGFGLASLATAATGLVLQVTLYRLFVADWYVAMVLLGPGLLYVVLACWIATPFAESLRQIQR